MKPVFITGIGTDVGKTLVSAIVAKALGAAYWKPIQAGGLDNTDGDIVKRLTGGTTTIFEECFRLHTPASPHISAAEEGINIEIELIQLDLEEIEKSNPEYLVIEGAGGLLVPINKHDTVADLIKALDIPVILVSRNYLGSINHSLLTAEYCQSQNFRVAGWIFTDEYMDYKEYIRQKSGYPYLASIPFMPEISEESVADAARDLAPTLIQAIDRVS